MLITGYFNIYFPYSMPRGLKRVVSPCYDHYVNFS
nr:MAG TPA: hypothetical protein [Bacteriophage sp.]